MFGPRHVHRCQISGHRGNVKKIGAFFGTGPHVTGLDRINAKTRETGSTAHAEAICTIGRLQTPNSHEVTTVRSS